MKNLLILAILISSLSFSYAQEGGTQYNTSNSENLNIPVEVSTKIDNFFKVLISGEVKSAYQEILKKSPILENDDDLINLVNQTKKSIKIYGDIKDYEVVNADKPSNSFIRLRYIGLHTKFPMRWIFTYYNSPTMGWIITNIKLDDMSEFFFKD